MHCWFMVYSFFLKIGIMGFFWMLFKNFEEKKILENMPAHLTCVHSRFFAYWTMVFYTRHYGKFKVKQ